MAKILYFLAIVLFAHMEPSESAEDPESFFPTDLTKVTWSHATNSQAELANAFAGNVKMIEADMQMGTIVGENVSLVPIPIMAHPPDNTSDLSFTDFMDQIVESNKNRSDKAQLQGIKLDFKTIETVQPALDILSNYTIDVPVWLNADILQGPYNSTGIPVNAAEFIRLTSLYRPNDTLSIGWKTSLPKDEGVLGQYTTDHINEMIEFLSSSSLAKSTPITFPLRAGFAAESLDNVVRLLQSWENSTVTLWGSDDDPTDVRKLIHFVNIVTKERCFVDLPFELKDNAASTIVGTSHLTILTFLTIFYYIL